MLDDRHGNVLKYSLLLLLACSRAHTSAWASALEALSRPLVPSILASIAIGKICLPPEFEEPVMRGRPWQSDIARSRFHSTFAILDIKAGLRVIF